MVLPGEEGPPFVLPSFLPPLELLTLAVGSTPGDTVVLLLAFLLEGVCRKTLTLILDCLQAVQGGFCQQKHTTETQTLK